MAEPATVADMNPDERQELKEAICDAILERTRRSVSGEGEHGRIVLGDRPSRVLSSAFLLPRLSADGDDESSDIRVASHGVDLRVRTDSVGSILVRPIFSVYVRALPSAEELFLPQNSRLVPPADFNTNAKAQLRDRIRARMDTRPTGEARAERVAAREAIARAVMQEMGVLVSSDANVAGVAGEGDQGDEPDANTAVARGRETRVRLRIPSEISREYEVPQKWIRIPVSVPAFVLALPYEPDIWRAAALSHRALMLDAARAACVSWIASAEGQLWAWRPGRVPSEAFWDHAGWEAYLARSRLTTPDLARLIPPLDIQVLADAREDPLRPGVASLRIAIENMREQDDDMECGVFSVSLQVELPDVALIPMHLERLRRSYHLAGFLSMPAVGVNGGVEDLSVAGGTRVLRTTWMPRFVLPRTRATVVGAVPTAYARLADSTLDLADLQELPREMRRWIQEVERNGRRWWPGEEGTAEDDALQQTRFLADLEAWRNEAERVARGADVLLRSQLAWRANPTNIEAAPYRAWLLLNKSFADSNPDRAGETPSGWRLFQMGVDLLRRRGSVVISRVCA